MDDIFSLRFGPQKFAKFARLVWAFIGILSCFVWAWHFKKSSHLKKDEFKNHIPLALAFGAFLVSRVVLLSGPSPQKPVKKNNKSNETPPPPKFRGCDRFFLQTTSAVMVGVCAMTILKLGLRLLLVALPGMCEDLGNFCKDGWQPIMNEGALFFFCAVELIIFRTTASVTDVNKYNNTLVMLTIACGLAAAFIPPDPRMNSFYMLVFSFASVVVHVIRRRTVQNADKDEESAAKQDGPDDSKDCEEEKVQKVPTCPTYVVHVLSVVFALALLTIPAFRKAGEKSEEKPEEKSEGAVALQRMSLTCVLFLFCTLLVLSLRLKRSNASFVTHYVELAE